MRAIVVLVASLVALASECVYCASTDISRLSNVPDQTNAGDNDNLLVPLPHTETRSPEQPDLGQSPQQHYEVEDIDFFISRKELPDNVPQDFWNRTSPPSSLRDRNQSLAFEFLHCSQPIEPGTFRVDGNCNYLAGEVARGSQFHLLIKGTRGLIGTCGLTKHLATWAAGTLWTKYPEEQMQLRNGLCVYDIERGAKFLRITN